MSDPTINSVNNQAPIIPIESEDDEGWSISGLLDGAGETLTEIGDEISKLLSSTSAPDGASVQNAPAARLQAQPKKADIPAAQSRDCEDQEGFVKLLCTLHEANPNNQ